MRLVLPFASALSLLLASGIVQSAEQKRVFAGEPVGEVLDNLRTQGLTFIYNTRIVAPALRVDSEPRARSGLPLAREILAAHGLDVSEVTSGVYAVTVRRRDAPPITETPVALAADTMLEEVVVHTSRYTLLAGSAAPDVLLTHEDIQDMPRLGEETLRAVQLLPGVATNGFSSLGSVRGGEPNETAIVLDGLRLYEPFHLKNFLSPVSLLDSRMIDSMHVYSGGFPVTYGDRMSSIIDAASLDPVQARYYEAGLSLFHAHALASSQFADGRGQGLISVRRGNIGDLARYSEKDFGKPEYFDGFAKLDYRFSDATRASFDVLGSSDRILAIRNSGMERANAEYRNSYAWGALEHDWADGAQSRVILSYTDVDNRRTGEIDEPGKRSVRVRDIRNFHVVGVRADHMFEARGLDHRIGAEVRRLSGSYDYESEVRFEPGFPHPDSGAMQLRRVAAPKPDGLESAAWWDGRIALGSRWTVQAGLRVDAQQYDGAVDAEQFSPRLNVLYQPGEVTRWRAGWGRFFQPQAINELQVEDGVERFQPAQYADHIILSVDHTLRTGLDLRIEAYRKDYGRLTPRFENLFNPLALLPETEFDRVMIAPDSARAEGIEVLLRWRSQDAWRGWFGYAWSQVQDRIDGRDVLRSWDQTHTINLGVRWESGPWAVTATNTFHSGWPTTGLSLSTTSSGAVQPVIGERNADRFDDYNSLDLRVTRTFALPRGALDVFIELSNAMSRENPCCVEYAVTEHPDGSVTLEDDIDSWLPLVPSVGVFWRY